MSHIQSHFNDKSVKLHSFTGKDIRTILNTPYQLQHKSYYQTSNGKIFNGGL